MKKTTIAIALIISTVLLGACDSRRYDQAIAVLIDVSGTYADHKSETVDVIKREILPNMVPGDTLLVIRIDSESYERGNVETLLTLDRRPSHANAQKLAAAHKLNNFALQTGSSKHTDIPGALMLAAEYLSEIKAGSSTILIFSDMQEDLPPGFRRELEDNELENVHVVAMNVKRLDRDTADPGKFRKRLATWEKRVVSAGAAEWRTLMDTTKLPTYLTAVR
jgi:hypothetical protein